LSGGQRGITSGIGVGVGVGIGLGVGGINAGSGPGASQPGLRGGKCTKTYTGHVNAKYCSFSAFSVSNPQRQTIVSGSEDGKIFLYDLQSRHVSQVLTGHSDAVLAVAAHDKKEVIASGGMSNDKTVRFWVPAKAME